MIIALQGPAGSGKSTITKHLVDNYGAAAYSLAAPLKDIATRVLDFTHAQCWGTQEDKETIDPRYGFSPRWFLQRLGTDGIRAVFGEDVWVDLLLKRIAEEKPALAVIEDSRFINESKKIIAAGGLVWKLHTPGKASACDSTHRSEQEWLIAPSTHEVRPSARGLEELYGIVDALASDVGLARVQGVPGKAAP